jgi:hypothetical protein
MDKARYIVCGAVMGSLLAYDVSLWVTNAGRVDTVGAIGLMAIPVGMIAGGFAGYRYEEYKAARTRPVWFSARDTDL